MYRRSFQLYSLAIVLMRGTELAPSASRAIRHLPTRTPHRSSDETHDTRRVKLAVHSAFPLAFSKRS
jgi:hypothetical protein